MPFQIGGKPAKMMTFEKNIDVLRQINPELAEAVVNVEKVGDLQVVTSKTGVPSARVGSVTLHSVYNPVEEAKTWIEHHREGIEKSSAVVVFGFGLGYHVLELLNLELLRVSNMDVIVFEPRLDVLRTALELTDLTSVLQRVRFITGNDVPNVGKDFIILEHKPSVTISQIYFEKIRERLETFQTIYSGLSIMVVGPIYGGSLPIARYCANALKNLGHKVDFVDTTLYRDALFAIDALTSNKVHRSQLMEMLINYVAETIIARCGEFKPDLVFALAQAPLSIGALQKLRANKIVTAFWFVEDFKLMTYWQRVAPHYDYFFTIQKGEFFDKLREVGVKNFSYLPLAASSDIHKKTELTAEETKEYGSDISFVGAGYYNRRMFFPGLLDLDFKIWGSEWDMNSPLGRVVQRASARIETEDTVKIFNAAKININLHSSTYHEGVNPYGDFVNPRTFELASCEAFQLSDYRSEMPDLFKIGEEIICFEDINDLRQKIKYYLENPEERERIAKRGRERVVKEHTYEHRMKEMLGFIAEKGYELPSWARGGEDVEKLVEEAGRNTELGRYLSRFLDRKRISISDVVSDIWSGKGEFTELEKIFMLIKEIKDQYAPTNS